MFQTNSVSNKVGRGRSVLLMCAVIALWAALPFIVQIASTTTHAQATDATSLVANLTGAPIGGATPRGSGSYYADTTFRQLGVSVSNVNLPAGTQLSVALNSSPIGNITLDWQRRGFLVLSTSNGGTVPMVVAGDALAVNNGAVTILTGTFGAPTTPSPTASQTPFPSPSPTGTHTPFPSPSQTPFPSPSPTGTHTPWPSPSGTPFPSPSQTPLPPHAFATNLIGANVVPPVTTDGHGFGFVGLNSDETKIRVSIGYRSLSSAATAITVNGPAPTGENGPVIFSLTLPTTYNYTSQTFDVTPEQVAQLRDRLWYLQVATTNNPDGEIRGQLKPITPRCCQIDTTGSRGGSPSAGSSDDTESDSRSYVPVPFDFDGDGITDIAVFRQSDGNWYITRSTDGRTVAYEAASE